ncbi:MAG: GDP-mannose 4,6-dehydratase [Nitrospirae bacterium]|nr:GDP-mannose 4,6-dehydratase [Nitrospirota bacterium]
MGKVLITGAAGVSGRNLARLLSTEKEMQICLTDLHVESGVDSFVCDLIDTDAVDRMLAEIRPDRIYHLAGGYYDDYATNYQINVLATKYLLDACLKHELHVRILLVGSAAEYGLVRPEDNPVREDHPLSPVSLYGLSKVYQTELMKYYRNVFDMDIVMARTFNLLGEGFSLKLFVGNLLQQIADYKHGIVDKIRVGNLENKRDYLPVADAVGFYKIIMDRGVSGQIYNVGSGKSVKIRNILNKLISENGIEQSSVVACMENRNASKIDIEDIFADISKLSGLIDCREI